MTPFWLLLLLTSPLTTPEIAEAWGVSTVPSESECRPYIEKALKERSPQEAVDTTSSEQAALPTTADQEGSIEETEEALTKESKEDEPQAEGPEESTETKEVTDPQSVEDATSAETTESVEALAESAETQETTSGESTAEEDAKTPPGEESDEVKEEVAADQPSLEDGSESTEASENAEAISSEGTTELPEGEQSAESPDDSTNDEKSVEQEDTKSGEEDTKSEEEDTKSGEEDTKSGEEDTKSGEEDTKSGEENLEETEKEEKSGEETISGEKLEATDESIEKVEESKEEAKSTEDDTGADSAETAGGEVTDSAETTDSLEVKESLEPGQSVETTETEEPQDNVEETGETTDASAEDTAEKKESEEITEANEASIEETKEVIDDSKEEVSETAESKEGIAEAEEEDEEKIETSDASSTEAIASESTEEKESGETITETEATAEDTQESAEVQSSETGAQENVTAEEEAVKEPEPTVEDQLMLEFDIPTVRRPRDHITEILRLSPDAAETELLLAKTIDSTLKELKRLYDAAIKPLELLFKYRDLSNRHFGDPEIFSKPLILFMGPWSGGKSTILNYLLDNEFKTSSLRTGAEPSPAYFNILMWGERQEVLDGTQLAADWTFSGLQKFGQGLLDRLRGLKMNNPLLEKVNIVEIPGILEIRKQVERLFPFNDACQWFIDRADIIFLVYDPSKLDVGPETEAILDQLKGREYQTRIILNKADQVKPEELMRVQGTLIWNISPLMSSSEPPVMYSTSLWSLPYEQGAPSRLLHAQEKAFLRDLRLAIDRRVENKIASARRFAVRVRNHAKMVDCYLTTYYNHKSFFGNRKKVADDITENPQNYHIYEGLSTLTNISRYDLPDPEVYRDFFRLNPLYDFQRLSDTCTYFRGCPINRLDVAIAYDLPELVGKYKKQAEKVLETAEAKQAAKS